MDSRDRTLCTLDKSRINRTKKYCLFEFINRLLELILDFVEFGECSVKGDLVLELLSVLLGKKLLFGEIERFFFGFFVDFALVIVFEEAPVRGVEVLLGFFQSTLNNVNLCDGQQPWKQKY